MYPDGYSYRALTRNPFTGAHGVKIFPASHWNLPRTRPLEAPKPDWAIHAQEGGLRASIMKSPATRFRDHFPGYPESSKIAPSLEREMIAAGYGPPPPPRCSRFKRTKSFSSTAESTTTNVSDTFANYHRSRFHRPSVSNGAETTTFTNTSAPTGSSRASVPSAAETTIFTTSTAARRVRASRFQPTKSFPTVSGTTTFTNTMSLRTHYTDPMPSTALPPLRAQQPAQKPATKPARVIQCDPLPGGKFPTTFSGLDYDTSKETMARTADEDYVIWKWIKKLGKGWGDQGLTWLQRQELQWRKRSTCYRQNVRKHQEEEREQDEENREQNEEMRKQDKEMREQEKREMEREVRLALIKKRADEQRADNKQRADAAREAIMNAARSAPEMDDQSTILSSVKDLTLRWTAALARRVGLRS